MQKIYYERNLPHWHPPGATYFLTYRLSGSLPKIAIQAIQSEIEQGLENIKQLYKNPAIYNPEIQKLQGLYFKKYDDVLDSGLNEPHWLKKPEIAQIIYDSLLFINSNKVEIHAFTIMSNHVHLLLTPKDSKRPLFRILQSHKSFTARQCNLLLGRTGQFWQEETYDHVVRNPDEFERIVKYIVQNPVKAKLVTDWQAWRWTYVKP
jgi:putative transposase